jgi:hydrophobe/amphiphile efflux-1 (HAE1) family protein/RND family efflux transporter MFP subunit
VSKTTKIILFLSILPFFMLSFSSCREEKSVTDAGESSVPVKITEVGRTDMKRSLSLTGDIEPWKEVNVVPSISGKVTKIYVQEGDKVKKDQLLAELDTEEARLQLEQAKAGLEVAEANYVDAKRNKKRMDKLLKENAISEQQHEKVRLAFEGAQAQLKQAKEALNLIQYYLDVSLMKAPFSGIITGKYINEGETINPMMPGGGGVVTLMDISKVKIRVNITQKDFRDIKKGLKALIKVDTFPDQIFDGKISIINPSIDLLTRSFEVKIEAQNPNLKLMAGMFARIEIVVEEKDDVVVVPTDAILKEDGSNYVFVVENNRAIKRMIGLGLREREQVEVKFGLLENEKIVTLMIFMGILIIGVVCLIQLPIDLMPKMELPSMSVITQYGGASAEDVEKLVTEVIESRVTTVPNIKDVISTSEENVSTVTMRFEWGTDLDEVANDVRQNLDFATSFLPEDAEEPMLVKFDLSMMPVVLLGAAADESYSQLYYLIDDKLCDPLKRLPGVAMTVIMGGKKREIQVNLDRQRLEAYHLSVDQVTGILAAENLTLSAGDIKLGRIGYVLRIPGEFDNVDQIKDVVIGNFEGTPIYIRDVAEVEDSFKDIDQRARLNRKKGLLVMVQKESDANTVNVANEIRKALPEITRKFPPDVKVFIAMDMSDFIKKSINNLATTLGWALLSVTLVVFIFLREIRGSFIVAITIPFSLIIAFIFMFLSDYTINMISLSAIAIAIGMVVDNAIVTYENTYRHRTEMRESRREASIFGPSEVGLAVTASTVTTVAIFFPIMFLPGLTGVMFKELALAVIIVLAASLFSALTLTPMLSSQIMRVPTSSSSQRGILKRFHDYSEKWFDRLENIYRNILQWVLGHRKITVGIGLGIFILSLLMLRFVDSEFIPTMDQGEIRGNVELPVGTRVEVTDKVMDRIEEIIEKDVPERELMYARCGISESGMESMMGTRSDTNIITVGGILVPKNQRKRSSAEINYLLGKEVSRIPGIKTVDFTPQDQMQMMLQGNEKPISVEIYGEDLEKTDAFALKVKNLMEDIPELWVEVDREKASALGLNMAQISNTLRTNFYGRTATKFREGGEEYDTSVRLKEEDRQSLADINNAFIASPMGKQIPISSIATIVERKGPLTLERKNQEQVVYVGGGLYERSLGAAVKDIKKGLSEIDIPDEVDVKIAGSAGNQAESFQYLLVALILGIVLIYMIMASQFESLIDPFIIMFSVPFAITGVIWALLITGKTLNIVSYIGMIMLVGIVVNNAILLVDYTNILRARGMNIREAILTSGRRRMRPVLMTALTTIFALLPLAIRSGEGSEMWSPLAVAVIGGLLVSTVVTLVFVPTLYSVLEERIKKNKNKAQEK